MRRRLSLVVLAVTSMIVIAFVVPLALLVHSQAHDRALVRAERAAQAVAASLAVATAVVPAAATDPLAVEILLGGASAGAHATVYLPDGTSVGAAVPASANVTRASSESPSAPGAWTGSRC